MLLGAMMLTSAGCHSRSRDPIMARENRAGVYAAVLGELRRESRADWVLVSALLPMTELDSELRDKVIAELPTTRKAIAAFVDAQSRSGDVFRSAVLAGAPWITVSLLQLDSLRASVRAAETNGGAIRGARNEAFWQEWQRRFPATAGYLFLSPVSVTNGGRSALVHLTIACGSICGETELRLLERDTAGGWRTVRRLRVSER